MCVDILFFDTLSRINRINWAEDREAETVNGRGDPTIVTLSVSNTRLEVAKQKVGRARCTDATASEYCFHHKEARPPSPVATTSSTQRSKEEPRTQAQAVWAISIKAKL